MFPDRSSNLQVKSLSFHQGEIVIHHFLSWKTWKIETCSRKIRNDKATNRFSTMESSLYLRLNLCRRRRRKKRSRSLDPLPPSMLLESGFAHQVLRAHRAPTEKKNNTALLKGKPIVKKHASHVKNFQNKVNSCEKSMAHNLYRTRC